MNVILRGTILYAADMFYNLKENELRNIERIEEDFMRKILKTTKGCPITSLYLVFGKIRNIQNEAAVPKVHTRATF